MCDQGLIRLVLHLASTGVTENLNISDNKEPAFNRVIRLIRLILPKVWQVWGINIGLMGITLSLTWLVVCCFFF